VHRLFASLFLVLLASLSLNAANYFVSPTGDDDSTGLDTTTAWASIDNGDQKTLLVPGDTINILSGTYFPSSDIQLKTHATSALPIIYRKYGTGSVVIDFNNQSNTMLIEGNHAIVKDLELTNTTEHAIELKADSCTITQCYIHDIDKIGIKVTGSYNLMLRDIVANTGGDGIENDGDYNNSYHNTVYYSGDCGIHYRGGVSTGRIFNNISVGNSEGIRGTSDVICGFNLLWWNSSDYTNGIIDSAGGIFADPLFVDTAAADFSLKVASPARDAGLDLGYPFLGSAPDMGALENPPHVPTNYYVSPSGDDDNDGLDTVSAWASIDNGDIKGILAPGDTVYILPGSYTTDSVFNLTSSGTAAQPITYAR